MDRSLDRSLDLSLDPSPPTMTRSRTSGALHAERRNRSRGIVVPRLVWWRCRRLIVVDTGADDAPTVDLKTLLHAHPRLVWWRSWCSLVLRYRCRCVLWVQFYRRHVLPPPPPNGKAAHRNAPPSPRGTGGDHRILLDVARLLVTQLVFL